MNRPVGFRILCKSTKENSVHPMHSVLTAMAKTAVVSDGLTMQFNQIACDKPNIEKFPFYFLLLNIPEVRLFKMSVSQYFKFCVLLFFCFDV